MVLARKNVDGSVQPFRCCRPWLRPRLVQRGHGTRDRSAHNDTTLRGPCGQAAPDGVQIDVPHRQPGMQSYAANRGNADCRFRLVSPLDATALKVAHVATSRRSKHVTPSCVLCYHLSAQTRRSSRRPQRAMDRAIHQNGPPPARLQYPNSDQTLNEINIVPLEASAIRHGACRYGSRQSPVASAMPAAPRLADSPRHLSGNAHVLSRLLWATRFARRES